MPVYVNQKAGPMVASDGSIVTFRASRDGAVIVGRAHGRFYESASRGTTFVAAVQQVNVGGSLGTQSPLLLVNPVGSGMNLSILKLTFAWFSGTLGAGVIWWAQGSGPAAPLPLESNNSNIVRNSARLGNTFPPNDVALLYANVGFFPAPVLVRPSAISMAPYLATNTVLNPIQVEDVSGELVVPPGRYIAVVPIFSGGSSVNISLAVTYEVVPQ
jgi:hypothetical protein